MKRLVLIFAALAVECFAQCGANGSIVVNPLTGKLDCTATASLAPAPIAYHVGICSGGVAGWRGNLPSSNAPTATGCASNRPVLQFTSGQAAQYWWAEYPVPAGVTNAVYEYTGHFRSADTTHSLSIPYAWECLAPGASYDSPAFNDGSGTWTVGAIASTGTQATTTITTTCDAGQIAAIKFTPTLTSFTSAMDWIDLYTPLSGVQGPAGNTILYGTAAPTTEGVDGNFYIRTTTNYIYGPKASGTWPAGVALTGGHTQNTDTGTTQTCFQLASGSSGPKLCTDGSGGLQVKSAADAVLATVDTSGVLTLGDGTAPWNLTGLTDDVAPGAPGTANQFTAYVLRSSGGLCFHLNGEGSPRCYAPLADPAFTGSLQLPNGTGPTVDAAGEIAVDTTTDQLQFYGGAKRALPSIQFLSFVIAAPAATDDFLLFKAPYGMTILSIKGVLAGTTNVVGQLQECDSSGASCADLDSDITFNGGEDSDDGSLTDSTIAKDNWVAWKTTSVSGSPTFLTVTVTYRVVPD